MKSKHDPRHQQRIDTMKSMFTASFDQNAIPNPDLVKPILENQAQIDALIQKCAPEWPLDQINRIDLAILRLAVHELLFSKTPYKVVIDEAVELAKEYGSENSAKFTNGVLGSVLENLS